VQLVSLDRSLVSRNWHWMAQLLRPAVERSDRTLTEVREALERGTSFEAATAHFDGGAMLIVTSRQRIDGEPVGFINYVAGRSTLRPKAWLRQAREIVAQIETLARRAGYRELRFGGRDWPLPGYEPYSTEHPHWVRKVLTDG
jgi:hypothetical protein